MTKRHLLLSLLLIILFQNQVFSQIKISGQIKNEKNNPVEFVEIQLQNKDSIIFKSELTNAEGKFILETKKGEYSLLIRQLGTIFHKQKINATEDIYIGIINITEKEQQLQEVVINSKKKLIERKVDRLIFNIENSISARGGDAIDALKITPNIRVQNDKIAMIGKSNMSVMIDDKLIQLSGDDLINFLKTIPSDNIKNIEIITTPPAKYEAKGNGGLINIKLKKNKKDSWSANIRGTYTQTTYPAGSIGGGFNYDKNKVSISSDLGVTNGSISPIYKTTFFYPSQTWHEENTNRNFYNIIRGRLGVNYKFSEKFSIGLQYIGSNNNKKNKEKDISTIKNSSENVKIFEGFFDFLSFKNIEKLLENKSSDYIILNSVSMILKIKNSLENYEKIDLYFDNDEAGNRAVEMLKNEIENVEDCRELYSDFKDLNDWAMSSTKMEEKLGGSLVQKVPKVYNKRGR